MKHTEDNGRNNVLSEILTKFAQKYEMNLSNNTMSEYYLNRDDKHYSTRIWVSTNNLVEFEMTKLATTDVSKLFVDGFTYEEQTYTQGADCESEEDVLKMITLFKGNALKFFSMDWHIS